MTTRSSSPMTKAIAAIVSTCFLIAAATSASAALTYVGAKGGASGNTVNTGTVAPGNQTDWYTGPDDGSGDTRVNGDNLWGSIGDQGFVTFDASLSAVWESSGDDAPELQTTISGLAAGTYDVYVLFGTATTAPGWEIMAGLNGGGLTEYNDTDGNVETTIAPFELRSVLLGQAIGTSFTVEIDDDANADANRERYIGVAYELVALAPSPAPEPSTTVLAALGLLGLMGFGRRRKARA